MSNPLSTPVERQAALTVGSVYSVAPGRIDVRLELDAPQTTALNTGSPTAFPRLNGFVIFPNEAGALVGIVTWLGIEHSAYPKRPGLQDFGLVDLPFPLRMMHVTPAGTLERGGAEAYRLRRGVVSFPSVGDSVALPSRDQLEALTRGEPEDRRVKIGRALLGNDAEVRVDPDKLFGRHLAVLGNTGSGKSCSVAGLIRWSLDAAQAARSTGKPNARFIVLDPNGEYGDALADLPGFKLFQVPPVEAEGARCLRVPAWLLNSDEWASVTVASTRTQRPVLAHSLRQLRTGSVPEGSRAMQLTRLARAYSSILAATKASPNNYTAFPQRNGVGNTLLALVEGFVGYGDVEGEEISECLQGVIASTSAVVDSRQDNGKYWKPFAEPDFDAIIAALDSLLDALPAVGDLPLGNEDVPLPFDCSVLVDHLDLVAAFDEFEDAARYLGTLKLRVRSLLEDERMKPILRPEDEPELEEWLDDFLGDGSKASVAVIDLSLVPSYVVEIVVAVMSRMIFEALQRHRRLTTTSLPTTLVLEEAHTFVHHRPFGEEYTSPGEMCVRIFERIAREGRKFGLGLVLSSQRPSELSATILAQCNSFLLHRLVNDRDQEIVSKLVPDNLSGLLKDLPSLPARHALLLGWASALPTLLEVAEVPEKHRPRSADPDFWDVWIGERTAIPKWKQIVEHWRGTAAPSDSD